MSHILIRTQACLLRVAKPQNVLPKKLRHRYTMKNLMKEFKHAFDVIWQAVIFIKHKYSQPCVWCLRRLSLPEESGLNFILRDVKFAPWVLRVYNNYFIDINIKDT